jgi:alpha/beta superfamily hydrolase
MRVDLPGPAGRLEGLLDLPERPRGVAVVFAHPHPLHGGTMHTKVVFQGAKALARIGCAVLRFNFRGVGASEGAWSGGDGEKEDFRAALDWLAARYPGWPIWAAGYSFGSWVALDVGARDDRVTLLIGVAVPAASYDFSAVRDSDKPKFFIHGERDELGPLAAMRKLYAAAREPKELVVIDGADHVFDGKTAEVGDALIDLLGDYG